MRPDFKTVIAELELLERLSDFHPVVIGTPPLGIATETSDIDIACTAPMLKDFRDFAGQAFSHMSRFSVAQMVVHGEPAVVVSFDFTGWTVELFCQAIDTDDQWGVRHFRIEERLLGLEPQLRGAVVRLKQRGTKTEPAFAKVLDLTGDPYQAVLDLETRSDEALCELIDRALPADS